MTIDFKDDSMKIHSIEVELVKDEPNYDYILDWAIEQEQTHDRSHMDLVIRVYQTCAEVGMATAINNLGALYYAGEYLPQDYAKAAELYHQAAMLGEYSGFCNLGYIFYYGRLGEPDYAKAFEYFMNGAALFQDGNCYYKLGDMYRNGLYVERSNTLTYQYYLRAYHAESRYLEDYMPDVAYRLACCLHDGIGVERDDDKALMYYAIARKGYLERVEDPFGYVQPRIEEINKTIKEILG